MSRLVGIPAVIYVELSDNDAEAQVEAELLRVAWDSDAPMPPAVLFKPDMAGDILVINELPLEDDAPEYRVDVTVEVGTQTDGFDAAMLLADEIIGVHQIYVHARNRYEAEQLAVRQLFASVAEEKRLHMGVIVNSIRIS